MSPATERQVLALIRLHAIEDEDAVWALIEDMPAEELRDVAFVLTSHCLTLLGPTVSETGKPESIATPEWLERRILELSFEEPG